jgi:uncharacterized protein YjdB
MLVVGVVVALAACQADGSGRVAGLTSPVGSTSGAAALSITPATARITVGTPLQLSTNAAAALQSQVEWSSLSPSVATVSQTGLVTAGAAGTATIRARFSSDTANVATATIQVTSATGTP